MNPNRALLIAVGCVCIFFGSAILRAVEVGDKVENLTKTKWWDGRELTEKDRQGKFAVVVLCKFMGPIYDKAVIASTAPDVSLDDYVLINAWSSQFEKACCGKRIDPPASIPADTPANVFVTRDQDYHKKFDFVANDSESSIVVYIISPSDVVLWKGVQSGLRQPGLLKYVIDQSVNPYLKDATLVSRFKAIEPGFHRFLSHSELCRLLEKTLIKKKDVAADAQALIELISSDIKKKIADADALAAAGKTFDAWQAYDSAFATFDGAAVLKDFRQAKQALEKDEQVKTGRAALKAWPAIRSKIDSIMTVRQPDKKTTDALIAEIEKFKAKYPSVLDEDIREATRIINVKTGAENGYATLNGYIPLLDGVLIDYEGNPFDAKKLMSIKYLIVFITDSKMSGCPETAETLKRFYLENNGGLDWDVVMFSYDRTNDDLAKLLFGMKAPWPTVRADKVWTCPLFLNNTTGIVPRIVLIDHKGSILLGGGTGILDVLKTKLAQ